MSVKYFCDVCSTEISPSEYGRVAGNFRKLNIEVMTGLQTTTTTGTHWNNGNVCHGCVIDAVNSLDRRTKEATVPLAVLEEERKKFQQETLRTSKLTEQLRDWIAVMYREGKTEEQAMLFESTARLLNTPINQSPAPRGGEKEK